MGCTDQRDTVGGVYVVVVEIPEDASIKAIDASDR
jgi:hypothetical protein